MDRVVTIWAGSLLLHRSIGGSRQSGHAASVQTDRQLWAGSGLTAARHGGSYDTEEAAIPATARKLLGVLNRMIADEIYL